ncbi:hypothetical protein [Segatella sp.]|uniref:hypothetical protein n=1 Tax=Segatella sp. TaxID=2974253 RepID=UPI00307F5FE9
MTETQHVIALNPYRKGNKGKVFSNSMAVYDKVIASPEIRKMIQQIRGELPIPKVNANDAEAVKKAQDRLKSELPFFCPHYGIFKNNVRRQENAQPESFMFQTIIDVDDREYVDKAIEKARELNCSDSIWNGSLLHLCYSARKKLHIGIRLPVGMTIEETQKAYCEALGVPYDESCITPERMIYLTDKDSEIYRSKMWCAVLSEKEILMRRQAYLDRGLTVDGRGGKVNSLQLTVDRANQQVNSLQLTGNRADEDYPDPPEMPKKLPKLVELLISRTPEVYKPAVAHAIFPPLATHLWKTRFRYIDNVEHEARLMTLLLAGTGAGKSSVNRPIDFIMEDIRLRDAENLKREKAWKDEMLRKGANKDKRKRPENLIIQEIDADMTNPAFVMRTAEAQEHFLYTSLNELDQFDALKGSGSQQFRIMCLAADPGNKYGQTRVGTMSVTERVTIRFNWNASTTIQKGQRYFSKVLTDGPISRINFCTIPEREIGEDMPVYGTYDESYREALRPYIENLNKVTGLIECKEAFQLALKLKDENAEFARLSQDRTFENLSFRANVIAYLKACVLYVANGCKWEPEIDEFIRWSEQYDLYCKMRFFGDMIAKENFTAQKSSKRGPQNLLQILPDSFTAAQLLAIRLEHGLDAKGTDMMIRQWLHRNYIRRAYQYTGKRDSCDSCDSFEKLKYRHDGMVIKS